MSKKDDLEGKTVYGYYTSTGVYISFDETQNDFSNPHKESIHPDFKAELNNVEELEQPPCEHDIRSTYKTEKYGITYRCVKCKKEFKPTSWEEVND